MKKIVINSEEGEIRAAVMQDGALTDLFIERTLHPRYAGNIYKGKVENVLPGMQAAFVDVGLEKNVFLYVDDIISQSEEKTKKSPKNKEVVEIDDVIIPKKSKSIKDVLKNGQEILVQVTKDPIGTKGARVITEITLPGRFVVLMPKVEYVGISRRIEDEDERDRLKKIAQGSKPKKMGVIVRTVAQGRSEAEITADIQFLVKLWKKLQLKMKKSKAPCLLHHDYDLIYRIMRDHISLDVDEIIVDKLEVHQKVLELMSLMSTDMSDRVSLYEGLEGVFANYGIDEEINKALKRKVWLDNGGYLVIDHTEALTVIDVNTGKFIGTTTLSDTVLKTNLEAAKEIARQLRIRNIGGIIVVDFIDMDEESHRKQVLATLEEAIQSDRTKATVLGFTQLGLVEMTRKKVQQSLSDIMTKSCSTCEGKGRVVSEESLAFKAMREIKKQALYVTQPAMLIQLHPGVASMLIGFGGSNLANIEESTGKLLYVKGNAALKPDEVKIVAVGSKEYIESKALPVKVGSTINVVIEEHHASNQKNGIARVEGYIIDVESAHKHVGESVSVEIQKVFKTYAKAKIIKNTDEQEAQKETSPLKKKAKVKKNEKTPVEEQGFENKQKQSDDTKSQKGVKSRENVKKQADYAENKRKPLENTELDKLKQKNKGITDKLQKDESSKKTSKVYTEERKNITDLKTHHSGNVSKRTKAENISADGDKKKAEKQVLDSKSELPVNKSYRRRKRSKNVNPNTKVEPKKDMKTIENKAQLQAKTSDFEDSIKTPVEGKTATQRKRRKHYPNKKNASNDDKRQNSEIKE